jgi:hypothetical protein
MSAYLSNLAKMVTQPGVGVQPRLPGRFEPTARAVLQPVDAAVSPTAAPSDPVRSPDIPLSRPTRGQLHDSAVEEGRSPGFQRPPARHDAVSPHGPRVRPNLHEATARPEIRPKVDVNELDTYPPATGAGQGEGSPAAPLLVDVAKPAQSPQVLRPDVYAFGQPPPGQPPLERVGADVSRRDAPLPGAAAVPPHEVEPAMPDLYRADDEPLLTGRELPRTIMPADPDHLPEAVDLVDTSAPPTIRVHIGRIEIRSAPPAPAPRPTPPRRRPAMSLDQYLQRRNGGGP